MATYDLKYPGAAIDAILDTAYDLQNAGYIFRGPASEYSNTPTERSWVLAGEGETGHGFTSPVPKGYIGVCVFNGTSWTGKLLKCVSIDSTPTSGSTNAVSSGGAYASISQLAATVNEALDNLTFTDSTPSAFLGEYIKEKVSTTAGGIERILTFFNILAATAEKAGLLSAADKQKLDAILGNLRSLKIDDTTAYADLGTKIVESIKATIGGQEETISTFQLLAATASKAGLLSAADKAKLDALWSSGYQFAGIATPSTTPISTTSKIFYIATEAGTYFNAVTVTQGINIIYKSGDTWSVAQVVGIDNEPTAGSDRLVKSGGVFGELALGAVYDVSAKNPTAGPNSDGKWESLSALLSDANLNTLIPTSVRKGGMSIKYVQSSDNKYVQFRCMANEFTTDVTQWQGVDDEPTAGSDNLIKSGGVCSVMEEHVGIPSRATVDFTSGEASRNIYYKVSKGWKLSGSVENKSTLSSNIYIKAYDVNDTQISAVTFNGVAQDEIRTFTFYSETDDIEYINIISSTRVVLDVVVSAEKSEQLRNELRDIYKDIDKRTVMFTPVNSGVYTLAYDNLAIKSGDSFKLFINANASWTRLIVSSDKIGTNRLYDVSDTASSFARVLTANVNIDKLYLCFVYTGTITLSSEILTNVAYSLSSTVEQQQTDIGQLTSAVTKSTSDIADIDADLYKEVDEVSWDSNSDLLKDINLSTLIGVKVRITISNTGSTNDTTVTLKAKSNVSGVIDIILDHIVINKGDSYTVDYTPSTFNVVTYQVQCNAGRTTCTILFEELTITRLADSITKQGTRIATIESNIIPTDYIENCTIDKNGALHVSQSNYKVSPFLGLDGSDIVLEKAAYINSGDTNIAIPCVFYDRDKNKLFFDSYYEPSNEGLQDITIRSSSIPKTAAYIRCTLHKANGKAISGVCNNIEDLQNIAASGFSLGNCRDYIIKDLAYRPLGEFTKGYIAFSADDGTLGAYTYTLPMVKQKDIPFTFFIASNSIIMRGQTQEERDIKDVFVQEFTAENTKIFAGQHALFNWTLLKEDELYNFFVKEKAFFDNLGIKIRGAVPPTGMTNPMINAMAGGLYDVVRCYWAVRDENNQIRTNENYYAVSEYFGAISSPRDNMFCLTSANIRDANLNKWKDVIDYAAEHKRLVNIYIHDFDFIETATDYLARRELLEAVIDYAKSKQGIEIIPFEKIPRLTASLPHTNVWGN